MSDQVPVTCPHCGYGGPAAILRRVIRPAPGTPVVHLVACPGCGKTLRLRRKARASSTDEALEAAEHPKLVGFRDHGPRCELLLSDGSSLPADVSAARLDARLTQQGLPGLAGLCAQRSMPVVADSFGLNDAEWDRARAVLRSSAAVAEAAKGFPQLAEVLALSYEAVRALPRRLYERLRGGALCAFLPHNFSPGTSPSGASVRGALTLSPAFQVFVWVNLTAGTAEAQGHHHSGGFLS